MNPVDSELDELFHRLDQIESILTQLVQGREKKEWYTTAEFADLTDRNEYTVREWCRHRRIQAKKKYSGRGKYPMWVISHEELERYRREGLLPLASG